MEMVRENLFVYWSDCPCLDPSFCLLISVKCYCLLPIGLSGFLDPVSEKSPTVSLSKQGFSADISQVISNMFHVYVHYVSSLAGNE